MMECAAPWVVEFVGRRKAALGQQGCSRPARLQQARTAVAGQGLATSGLSQGGCEVKAVAPI